jgi:hypothetical protein
VRQNAMEFAAPKTGMQHMLHGWMPACWAPPASAGMTPCVQPRASLHLSWSVAAARCCAMLPAVWISLRLCWVDLHADWVVLPACWVIWPVLCQVGRPAAC